MPWEGRGTGVIPRITPRFTRYERADLRIGIGFVVAGAAALMGATAAAFAGTRGFGQFTDAAGLASGLQAYAGLAAGVLFAVALLDASIIGAFAVSLSTAYAISDVFGLNHSLHRGVKGAKGLLHHLRRADQRLRHDRTHPRLPARAADRVRPGPGRRAGHHTRAGRDKYRRAAAGGAGRRDAPARGWPGPS